MGTSYAHKTMQRTLKYSISYVGTGLHTGAKTIMTIKPAEENSGIVFVRKDVHETDNRVPARWYNVSDTTMSTTLSNKDDISVGTVEHLMAALLGCGVDNAIIEVDGPEVPIMDGSARPFVSVIEKTGTVDQSVSRKAIWIHRPTEVRHGDKYAILMPSDLPRITVEINFANSAIGSQTHSMALINEAFRNDISRARTFGFKSELKQLKHQGLAKGGTLNNAILVDGDRIVNQEGLRYENEFVRHKVLDAMGDLALAGVPVIGHFYAYKPGHQLNNALIKQLMQIPDGWSYVPIDDINTLLGSKVSKKIYSSRPARIKSA